MTESSYDVVICGGGLVGASLALSLAHLPLRICLVDPIAAPPPPSRDDRTFTLAQGSKRALVSLGVWPLLSPQSFEPIQEIHVSDRAGGFGFTHIRAAEVGVDALGFVTQNAALLGALYKALHSTSVTLRVGLFEQVDQQIDEAVVTVEGPQGRERLHTRLLVGADGTQSAVSAFCAIPVSKQDYGREALVANCHMSAPKRGVAFERFTPEGPIAALPIGDNRYTFVVSRASAKEWQDMPEAEFLSELHRIFGDRLGRFLQVGRRLRFPLIRQNAPRPIAARVVLVGNAAHTLHPVAGQGFNLGLRDVAVLADRIAQATRQHEDFGSMPQLEAYGASRVQDTANTMRFTDGLIRLFSHDVGPITTARNVGLTLVDCLPPLKRALALRTMGLKGSLPRLMRGLKP